MTPDAAERRARALLDGHSLARDAAPDLARDVLALLAALRHAHAALDAQRAECAERKALSRKAAQVLIAEVGASGPMSVLDAAERAVAHIARLDAQRAVSAAAAERYTAAWDAVGTMPPTPAQSEEIAAALLAAYEAGDALTAALGATGEGR